MNIHISLLHITEKKPFQVYEFQIISNIQYFKLIIII